MHQTLHSSDIAQGQCPVDPAVADGLQPGDVLVLPMARRMVVQQAVSEDGRPELFLYYEDKEVSFDEPHLFAFGETLARQDRFRADASTKWGAGYSWSEVKTLLESLIEAEILELAGETADVAAISNARPSPLPPARTTISRTWADCAAITLDLAGRAVDPAHLELIVPMFRVAHMALDADGRQVGEANVFPRPLRLDTPTEWMACPFPGTRYMADRPMNTSALKAMRSHWPQMMAALKVIRAHFLRRFPEAADGWTLAHVERLAALVLAVPTYQLVHNGGEATLHPALSSLFRVTDGLRMATHQMMFIPVGEPVLPPDTAITAEAIFAYAERNYSFHSETGVCAGPSHMVRAFLDAVLHGEAEADFAFDLEVAEALNQIDAAFDYGLHGMQAHTALFRFWPAMARAYERLGEVAAAAVAAGEDRFAGLSLRLSGLVSNMKRVTLLGTEERRASREHAYAGIFDQCVPRSVRAPDGLEAQFASVRVNPAGLAAELAAHLAPTLGRSSHAGAFALALADFAVDTQAIIAVSERCQAQLNRSIGRPAPQRPFSAADIAVHGRLLGNVPQRLPFLTEELAEALGLTLSIDAGGVAVSASSDFHSSADNR